MPGEEIQFRCTIKRIFNGCPKPGGWYGCFAYAPKFRHDIKLTGITSLTLAEQMVLDVTAKPSEKDNGDSYVWTEISIVTQTKRGIIAYLSSIKGISKAVATKIANRFGDTTIAAIENDDPALKTDCNLSDKQLTILKENVAVANAKNNMQKMFPELTPKQIDYILKLFDQPVDTIRNNPYSLCDVPSITFKQADAIALRLGFPPTSPFRVNHGLYHVLSNISGHSYVNLSNDDEYRMLYLSVENLLNIRFTGFDEFADRIRTFAQITGSPIVLDVMNGETHLYTAEMYHAVDVTCRILKSHHAVNYTDSYVSQAIRDYEIKNNMQLTNEQKIAVSTSLKNPISVITGGPGRGKTTIIDCVASNWTKGTVMLLAPTGKAANKLNSATKSKFTKNTMTVDKITVMLANNEKQQKIINTDSTLIIIDESSMLDIRKASRIIELCSKCNFCFVGDVDQLPPIEPGNFLKDIIDSTVIPTSILTVPLRNSGAILSNADKINANDPNLAYNFTDMPFFPYADENQDMLDAVIDRYNTEKTNCPDITQLALICPVKKGIVGTVHLNIIIQDIACPVNNAIPPSRDQRRDRMNFVNKGHEIPSQLYGNATYYTRFRVGDIVMNTKNQNQIQTAVYSNNDFWNGEPVSTALGIFNGECGKIIAYVPHQSSALGEDQSETVIVQFFDGRIAQLDCEAGEFENFQLGYAITVHKSQGCEYDTVIYVSPKSMLNCTEIGFACKNLIYTAVTRAKQKIVIMGSKDGLNACITHNAPKRNSSLAAKLRD